MAVTATVATVVSTGMSFRGRRKAKKAAKKQARAETAFAKKEAENSEAETAESVRRAEEQASSAESTSRARAAGSGVASGGSVDIALDAMSEEHRRQIDWMAEAGASAARMALEGGVMRSDAARAQASAFDAQMWGGLATGATNIYRAGGTQGAGWWG